MTLTGGCFWFATESMQRSAVLGIRYKVILATRPTAAP